MRHRVGPCAERVRPTGLGKEFSQMSENETNQRTVGEDLASSRMRGSPVGETSHGVTGPHFSSHSPRVLARVPDLESAESEVAEGARRTGRDGRMLSSPLSVKILAGGGALLLLAALGLPFFFGNSDTPEPAPKDELPAWQPEHPAPSAPAAPAWDGPSVGASSWEVPPSADGFSRPGTSATSAWNEDLQPYGRAEPSQAQPWVPPTGSQPWAQGADSQAASEQPPAQAWNGQAATMPSDAQPQWQVPGGQTDTSTWSGQVDVASGRWPRDQAGWSTQPSATPERYQEPAVSWNEETQLPSWQVPTYGAAGQVQAGVTTPPRYDPYQSPPDSSQPPQAGTNRSMTIGDYAPAGIPDYRTNYPQNDQALYRAADARANSRMGSRLDYQPSYPNASESAQYPSTYPVAGARSTQGYGAGPYPGSSEPGVARFKGGIEKPTEGNVYDLDRSSTY